MSGTLHTGPGLGQEFSSSYISTSHRLPQYGVLASDGSHLPTQQSRPEQGQGQDSHPAHL